MNMTTVVTQVNVDKHGILPDILQIPALQNSSSR